MERIRGGWARVPDHLKCKTDLKKMGLTPTGEAKAEVWNQFQWVKLFDIHETSVRKPPSEKQRAAIQKAQETRLRLRTCLECKEVQSSRGDLRNGLCEYCRHLEWMRRQREQARQQFVSWWADKDRYVILDTETTGLDGFDEVLEIAVIDLDGNVIMNTLLKPTVPIQEAAYAVHGISEEDVAYAPTFADIAGELRRVVVDKTVLIYNEALDTRLIEQSGRKYGFTLAFNSNCVMETYAKYYGDYHDYRQSFRWIKLVDAANYEDVGGLQTHRAVGDCQLVRQLIQAIAERRRPDEHVESAS